MSTLTVPFDATPAEAERNLAGVRWSNLAKLFANPQSECDMYAWLAAQGVAPAPSPLAEGYANRGTIVGKFYGEQAATKLGAEGWSVVLEGEVPWSDPEDFLAEPVGTLHPDVVATRGDRRQVIEVKSRTATKAGDPPKAVDADRLQAAGQAVAVGATRAWLLIVDPSSTAHTWEIVEAEWFARAREVMTRTAKVVGGGQPELPVWAHERASVCFLCPMRQACSRPPEPRLELVEDPRFVLAAQGLFYAEQRMADPEHNGSGTKADRDAYRGELDDLVPPGESRQFGPWLVRRTRNNRWSVVDQEAH